MTFKSILNKILYIFKQKISKKIIYALEKYILGHKLKNLHFYKDKT